jgi:hypothetical protein
VAMDGPTSPTAPPVAAVGDGPGELAGEWDEP